MIKPFKSSFGKFTKNSDRKSTQELFFPFLNILIFLTTGLSGNGANPLIHVFCFDLI